MIDFLSVAYIIICILLILLILLQPGKGGGMGAIGGGGGGGGGGGSSMFGARGSVGFMGKLTAWLGAAFMVLSLTLAALSIDRSGLKEDAPQEEADTANATDSTSVDATKTDATKTEATKAEATKAVPQNTGKTIVRDTPTTVDVKDTTPPTPAPTAVKPPAANPTDRPSGAAVIPAATDTKDEVKKVDGSASDTNGTANNTP